MTEEDLVYQNAHQLATWIRTKQISSQELVKAYLKQINQLNPQINAIVQLLDDEKVFQMAKTADEQLAKNEKIGHLHGLPIAVKEMLQTKGWKSTFCWAAGAMEEDLAFMGFSKTQEEDGLLAHRMRQAGALIIGKTNMPEFAFGSHTKNDLFGITSNPYHLSKTVGGSSGGAAAALASGMLPLADGSDLGGSLRNPAAFCNVVGFRPSIGRVPMLHSGWTARMATEGPMARSVKDIALLLAAQAGPHPEDPLSIQQTADQFLESLKTNTKGLKIGWTQDFGYLPIEPSVQNTSQQALKYFKDLGIQITDEFPKVSRDAMDTFRTLRVLNIADNIQQFRKALGEEGIRKYTNPIVQYQFIEAFHKVDRQAIFKAMGHRKEIYAQFQAFFKKHDFLICPSTQVSPFDISIDYVRSINGQKMTDYLEWMSICCIPSMTGLPIISMPCGFTNDGLPLGIQIIGKPGADLEVLKLAQAFEEASQLSAQFKSRRPQ